MAYIFATLTLGIVTLFSWYVSKLFKRILLLESIVLQLFNTMQESVKLSTTTSNSLLKQLEVYKLISKQTHNLSLEFYDFRSQVDQGFNIVADYIDSPKLLKESYEVKEEEDKEKKPN